MPLVQCQNCPVCDTPEGCSGFDDCPELKKYDQAMTELKAILPNLMSEYDPDPWFSTVGHYCYFCNSFGKEEVETHGDNCLGKRLLEIL